MDAPAFEPRNPRYEQRVRDSFARQGARALLGAELTRVAPGTCEIRLPWRRDLTQQHGFFHGGLLAAVADSAAGYAGFTLMPAHVTVLSIEFKTNFLSPARGEALVVRARVLRSGRTITVAEAHVFAVDGGSERLCATMTQTMMAVEGRDEAAA